MQELIDLPKKLVGAIGLDENSEFYSLIDAGVTFAPYLGKLWHMLKINRLERRVREHQTQLLRINQLMKGTKLSANYIKERIFPIVFEDILEDHEESKINYILNGFQNMMIEEKQEEALVLNYFDTLRELRYADIRRFFYFSGYDDDFPNWESEESEGFKKSVDQKLTRLGLINLRLRWDELEGYDLPRTRENVTVSNFGRRFFKFISPEIIGNH